MFIEMSIKTIYRKYATIQFNTFNHNKYCTNLLGYRKEALINFFCNVFFAYIPFFLESYLTLFFSFDTEEPDVRMYSSRKTKTHIGSSIIPSSSIRPLWVKELKLQINIIIEACCRSDTSLNAVSTEVNISSQSSNNFERSTLELVENPKEIFLCY